MSLDPDDEFKRADAVTSRDERWRVFGNRSLKQHHTLISEYSLHGGVSSTVAQHYENARNTWLYAFFSYRLLQVALMQLHVAGEVAIKERAKREGIDLKSKSANTLEKLLRIALEQRWLLDAHFEVTSERERREAEHLEMLRFMGVEHEPFVGPQHEQDYSKGLVNAFRHIRNSLAHGEVLLRMV